MNAQETTERQGEILGGETIDTLLRYLKALADQSRLRLLGILASRERSVEELAVLLDLKAPTVSHHLARLRELDLVGLRVEGNTHYYWLNVPSVERLSKALGSLSAPARVAALAVGAASGETSLDAEGGPFDPWERKALRDFFDGERLREIPTTRKKRDVILKWLVERFAWDHIYSEAEVNATLQRHHPDTAYLRRELIGLRLMRRERGQYWRSAPPTDEMIEELTRQFEWGRIYTEDEVNAILRERQRDIAALRQELLARNILASERAGYWLTRPPTERLDSASSSPRG